MSLADTVAHLHPEHWERANRLLIRKALAEFSHERLLTPEPDGDGWAVRSDDGRTRYRFTATLRALDHWQVDAASVTRLRDGAELPLDALEFFLEFQDSLGLSQDVLPVYLEEISSTLSSTCYKLTKPQVTSAELAERGFQAIETGMTEGHPCFVANNGRLGFGIEDYLAYAPETAHTVKLVWLAAHRSRAAFTAGAGLDHDSFLRQELGEETVARFRGVLRGQGLDPDDYLFLPVHPWQWRNKLTVTSAAKVTVSLLRHCQGWPAGTSSSWARARTTTRRSSPSGPSSTPRTLRSTTSRRPCRCSTWVSCAVCRPRTWRPPPPSTTGSPG